MKGVTRIHYEIDDDLHYRVKVAAATKKVSLRQFLIDALEAALAKEAKKTVIRRTKT